MATASMIDSGLVITFDAGLDKEGKPVTKRKSFNSVKTAAADDGLFAVAEALVPLQQYDLVSIDRNNTINITA